MAFDRENPTDLTALYNERTQDPVGMGYPANDNQFIRVINSADDNVGGETTGRPFDVDALLDALDPSELGDQQTVAGADTYTQLLTDLATAGRSIETYKVKWRSMFAANSATVTALDAQVRGLSRAEVLFGEGVKLVVDDWIAARVHVEGA